MNVCAVGALVLVAGLGIQSMRVSMAHEELAREQKAWAEERAQIAEERTKYEAEQRRLRDAKDAEIRRIAAARDRALDELRKRPERLPEPAREACKGATGAELSGRDAEFLARLAARADELRAALRACQGG